MAACCDIFLTQTGSVPAKAAFIIASQIFEVQLDQSCVIKICREIVPCVGRRSAHANDRISHFGRQMINMLRIPGIVVSDLAGARMSGKLTPERKQPSPNRDHEEPNQKSTHRTLRELPGCMTLDSD
jgi:hypothetical protein